ncbi:unnamed protein product [Arabidopsis arenosa]|uniref:Rad60/SUMO-like domain-containing protein n=1 Tax=Arabidopsis arenosa TaxID=38785 RepID=A0A8S2B330_ARAAE|nr:unnamed protein product [Arabidopsis arenosa]
MSTTRSDITDDGNFDGGDEGGVTDQEEKKFVLQISFGNDVRYFRMKRKCLLSRLMKLYCESKNLDFENVIFLYNGRRLRPELTPDDVDMENGAAIEAILVRSM